MARKAQRVKGFIDANVHDEARRRMHHIYDIFDTVMVAFSGGKDSLVALHIARQVALERGDESPIKVVFRDQELIPDPVLDFVNEYRQFEWIDMRGYCVPLKSAKYILGTSTEYVQWDPDRQWLRPQPEWALTPEKLGIPPGHAWGMSDIDALLSRDERGKVAIVTGLRASESIMRFNACKHKIHDNYITATGDSRTMTAKPIFDWHENDVFRFFYDHSIRYCPLYDAQLWSGTPLRVSTPLHAESAKTFGKIREFAPTFYGQVIELVPEMAVQERYYRALDREALMERYGQSFEGVRAWVEENAATETQLRKGLRLLRGARMRAAESPEAYPPDHVLKQLMSGIDHKHDILPLIKTEQASRRRRALA
jgi:predicted phosphoadenosine phosphosulfate sulfurtransferase